MKLLRLTLNNFKGIKDFTLDAQGENVSIFADNALGKTTIFDAFLWLLFDKDSQNKKDFQIKTLDKAGEVIHGLSHEVEGAFEINGRSVTLKKAYAEKWTKKRGQATAEFTGHTTDYFINSVPSQKKEFDAFVAGIADESIFKLLTSPTYFNEQLHWQKRRETLLEVCGDISDEAVIASDKKLAKLPAILQGRALEDHRKVIAAKRAEINKELEKIPVRIDEANRSLPAVSDMDVFTAIDNAGFMKHELQEKQAELARVEGGGEIAEKRKRLAEVEGEILRLQNDQREADNKLIDKMNISLNEAKDRAREAQSKITYQEDVIGRNEAEQATLTEKVEFLRCKWHETNDKEFTFSQESVCPACGQDLPEEKLTEVREKALAQHNQLKAEALESISQSGKDASAKIKLLQGDHKVAADLLEIFRAEFEQACHDVLTINTAIHDFKTKTQPITKDHTQLLTQKEQLEQAITQLRIGSNEASEGVRKEIADLNTAITVAEAVLAMIKQRETGLVRIVELKGQEKTLAAEYERLEGELYLTEQFIRTKVAMLEDRINSRFKYARFKMFSENINGGVEPTCQTLLGGVPYESMNSAGRVQVGCDIIATLQEFYGFAGPVWIDNRESVVMLPEMDCQMISLYVSEKDKVLRVETDRRDVMS